MQPLIDESALVSAYAGYLSHGDFESAMSWCRALRLAGRAEEAQDVCLGWRGKIDGAFEHAQLGIEMNFLGLFEQSEEQLSSVADAFPYDTNRHLLMTELAIARFLLGKYHEAHKIFRFLRDREECANLVRVLSPHAGEDTWRFYQSKFLAMSDPIEGKRIAIVQEGGVGDLIMYSRYVDMLVRDGARSVCIQAPRTLHGCLDPDRRFTIVETQGAELIECDYITTVFSLFARYQKNRYFLPTRSSVIGLPADAVPPADMAEVMDETSTDGRSTERKVGLIWRSASGVRHEPYRSIDLRQLTALLENQPLRIFSLQVGNLSTAEKALMAEHRIVDLGPHLRTFADTAAAIQKLDLLISIDTGPAHLAGTLGCPVWLLLSQACDGRWYDCQRFTPWYSSMRLFRQRKLGDWTAPLNDARSALALPFID